jgi:hypothetical protein
VVGVTYEAVGLLLLGMGLLTIGAAMLMSLRRVRREVFTVLRHPSYTFGASATYTDDHSLTVYERLPLHDWSEAGEL